MKRFIAFGVFLIAILVGIIFYFRPHPPSDFGRQETLKVKGTQGAPIEIIEYSNFECRSCGEIQPVLAGLLRKYPGKIKLVFRHYPGFGSQHSLWAHVAAECAALKRVFWPYHDKLFENQRQWTTSPEPLKYFIQYAREIGLDAKEFSDCLLNENVLKRVRDEDQAGMRLGLRTTPSFVVNGEIFVGVTQFNEKAVPKIESQLTGSGASA